MVRRTLLPAFAAVALCAATAGAQSARHTTHSTRTTHSKASSSSKASSRAASSSASWAPVYTDDAVTVSLDRAGTHRRSDGTYDAHLKWAYNKDKAIGRNKSYRTLVERRYLDCTSLASKPVSGDTYDAANASVSHYATSTRDLKYVDWATRPAGTSGAKAYAAVCQAIAKH